MSAPSAEIPAGELPVPIILAAGLVAATLPTLLAYNLPPSATLMNQCLAVGLWGVWLMVAAAAQRPRGTAPLLAALGLVALSALGSMAVGALPASLSVASFGVLVAAMAMVAGGAAAARQPRSTVLWQSFAAGCLLAGTLSALVACIQVFAPGWTDGTWIAHSGLAGRAVGNLRQPNHLCSLLLWALLAAVALHEQGRLPTRGLWLLSVLLVFAVELSASRTGAVGLLLLPLWAWTDRRLSPAARRVLWLAPLMYLAAYGLMLAWGHLNEQAIGAAARVEAEVGAPQSRNSRLNIWSNTLALIRANPWTGVGYGEFNLAWTLTPFAGRPTAFFDHCHNLPLQLLVELGLPVGGLVLLLMAWALRDAVRRSWAQPQAAGVAPRAALAMVLMIGLHSMVEYPLWYSYFLLPAAWAWGFALGQPEPGLPAPSPEPQQPAAALPAAGRPAPLLRWGAVAGTVLLASGMLALWDYLNVVAIYSPVDGDQRSLDERIRRGQHSPLFAHHADYAAATNPVPAAQAELGFRRAVHNLLDTRLMNAWARHLAQQGEVDLARNLAQRVIDFGTAEPDAPSESCRPGAAAPAEAWACEPPRHAHAWREYLLGQPTPPAVPATVRPSPDLTPASPVTR